MNTVPQIPLLGEISREGVFIYDWLTDDIVPFTLTAAAIDELERPADPGDVQWITTTRPVTHVPTPEETRMAFQMLIDAGCTFPNFQQPRPPVNPLDGLPYGDIADTLPTPLDDDGNELPETTRDDTPRCPRCGAPLSIYGDCDHCDFDDDEDGYEDYEDESGWED
jgi:hypothetical protein